MANSSTVFMVWTNWPEDHDLTSVTDTLLKEKLAACINRFPVVESAYIWHGQTETAREIPLLLKTTSDLYPALEQRIKALHPYELPEIIAVSVEQGLPAYLQWVDNATSL